MLKQPGAVRVAGVRRQGEGHLLRPEYGDKAVTRVTANTLEELAAKMEGVNAEGFLKTVREFNAAVNNDVPFNHAVKDGRCTVGIEPPKSNWANPLDTPPFEAYHVTCGITFTFGGLRIDHETGQVLDVNMHPIPGALHRGRDGRRPLLLQLPGGHRPGRGCWKVRGPPPPFRGPQRGGGVAPRLCPRGRDHHHAPPTLLGVALFCCCRRPPPGRSGAPHARPGDLGGIVASANGPEAGVWVIAETNDLPTKFAKIVVTDDRGRYVLPDLPKANYSVWVRGYGLIDSPRVESAPGKLLDLKAVVALTPAAAADYYPAIYWYSMLKIPEKSDFSAAGGKGIENVKTQAEWLNLVKTNGCVTCHQMGNKATRTIPKDFAHIKPSTEAWSTRILSGQAMTQMATALGRIDAPVALSVVRRLDRSHRGRRAARLAAAAPARRGAQHRHHVVGLEPPHRVHARRNFHRQAQSDGQREWTALRHARREHGLHSGPRPGAPHGDRSEAPGARSEYAVVQRLALVAVSLLGVDADLGQPDQHAQPDVRREGPCLVHRARASAANPAFCRKGSDHPSAKAFPVERSNRHLSMYDPKTGPTSR